MGTSIFVLFKRALLSHRTNAKLFLFVLSFDSNKEGNDPIHRRPSRRELPVADAGFKERGGCSVGEITKRGRVREGDVPPPTLRAEAFENVNSVC